MSPGEIREIPPAQIPPASVSTRPGPPGIADNPRFQKNRLTMPVPESGHRIHEEHPKEMTDMLLRFLDGPR